MGYVKSETLGELLKVFKLKDLEKKTSDLIFPDSTPVTGVLIQGRVAQWEKPVFGEVLEEYVGKEVRLLDTYQNTSAGVLFMQEMYVEGKCVLNTAIVRKNDF